MRGFFGTVATTALLLTSSILGNGHAQERYLVVDTQGGPGLFRTIQSAIDAARDGDKVVVLRAPGNEAIVIAKKAITLFGPGTETRLFGTLTISDPPPNKTVSVCNFNLNILGGAFRIDAGTDTRVVIENFTVLGYPLPDTKVIIRSRGEVIFQSCTFKAQSVPLAERLMSIVGSDSVTLNACQVFGAGGLSGRPGGVGIACADSVLRLQDTTVVGGMGGESCNVHFCKRTGEAASAIVASRSRLIMSGASRVLKSAGTGNRAAMVLAQSQLQHPKSTVQSINADASSKITVETLPSLELSKHFRFGATVDFTFRGEAGSACIVLMSHGVQAIDLPFGRLVPSLNTWFHTLAAPVNSSGSVVIRSAVGSNPISLGRAMFCQAVEFGANRQLRLTSPVAGIVRLP